MRVNIERRFKRESFGLTVVFDASEIYPNDPGLGTPVMVYSQQERLSATWHCAVSEGELLGGGVCGYLALSRRQSEWLQSLEPLVEKFYEKWGGEHAQA